MNRRMILASLLYGTALLQPRMSRSSEPPITALAFAPDGRSVVVGSASGLSIKSWPDLKPGRTLSTEVPRIHDVAFSPLGDVLAVGGGLPARSGSVELFRWPAGTRIYLDEPHDDVVYALAWAADATAWASASLDHTVQIHHPKGETVRILEGHSKGVLGVSFLAEGSVVSAGIDRSVRVWSGEGRPLRRLENHTGTIHGLAVRPAQPAGRPPAVVTIGDDRTIRLWQPTIGRMVRLARLESTPLAVTWTIDGTRIAIVCTDEHVRLLDPDSLTVQLDTLGLTGRSTCIAASLDGLALLVGGENGRLKRIDIDRPPLSDHAPRFSPPDSSTSGKPKR